jgi:hypothetical protein
MALISLGLGLFFGVVTLLFWGAAGWGEVGESATDEHGSTRIFGSGAVVTNADRLDRVDEL